MKQYRQHYECPVCGLKSWILIREDAEFLDTAHRMDADHAKQSSGCSNNFERFVIGHRKEDIS